jgi:ATP-dependent DNA helicase DinG
MKANNDDRWFTDMILPRTVLQFKQGVGRLLRSKKDYGAIVVLDERIVEKEYGKRFLSPRYNFEVVDGGAEDLERRIREWFHKWRGEDDGRGEEEEG